IRSRHAKSGSVSELKTMYLLLAVRNREERELLSVVTGRSSRSVTSSCCHPCRTGPLGARPGRDAAYCSALIWNSQDSCPERLLRRSPVNTPWCRRCLGPGRLGECDSGHLRIGAVTALL